MIKKNLPRMPVERIIKKVSVSQGIRRVSKEAVDEMIRILEERGISMSSQASQLASHAGRKTIKSEDIELAHVR